MVAHSTDPQTLQTTPIALGYLPELGGKITLLKTLTYLSHRTWEKSSWYQPGKFIPYLIAFIVLGGSTHSIKRKILHNHTQVCTLEATIITYLARYAHLCKRYVAQTLWE